tara:strand:+ start:528 stop:1052 length:525 start_codon:yes stop_codon:yes gene_type:complete
MDIILFNGEGHKVDLAKSIPRSIQKENIVIVQGGENKINRSALSNKFVDILLDPHMNRRKDFMHHRDSGLNQVLCKLAKERNIAIGFSFSAILKSKNLPEDLGRIIQNIKLCRKYKVKMVIASFAKNKNEQRNIKDIQSFFKVLGMTGKELQCDFVKERLGFKKKFITKGVRLA